MSSVVVSNSDILLGRQQTAARVLAPGASVPTFQFTVKTDNAGVSNSDQFKLPLSSSGTYDFSIDWGDGNSDNITVWNQAETTHTYSSAGTYTIKITGTIQKWSFNGTQDPLKFLEVSSWGPLNLTSSSKCFFGCSNFTCTATDIFIKNDSDFSELFRNCNLFDGTSMDLLDVSTATNMAQMFRHNSGVNDVFNVDLNGWDVSGVTNFSLMFQRCRVLNSSFSAWDVSSGQQFNGMFEGCSAFQGNGLENWLTPNMTTCAEMFIQCAVFNADVSGFDVSGVTNMNGVFRQCNAFNQDLSGWDVTGVTNMNNMFEDTLIDFSFAGWDVTSLTTANNFMIGANELSTANYDATLIAWDALVLTAGVSIHFGNAQYTKSPSAAATARANIVATPWTITDGGPTP